MLQELHTVGNSFNERIKATGWKLDYDFEVYLLIEDVVSKIPTDLIYDLVFSPQITRIVNLKA